MDASLKAAADKRESCYDEAGHAALAYHSRELQGHWRKRVRNWA